MKVLPIIFFTLLLVAGFGVSISYSEAYLSGNFGAVAVNKTTVQFGSLSGDASFKAGSVFTGAFGSDVDFHNSGRVELEFAQRFSEIDEVAPAKFDVTALSVMFNAYHDYKTNYAISPFVGLGLGIAELEAEVNYLGAVGKADDLVFAYQVMVGVGYEVFDNLFLDAQYRFFGTGRPDFQGVKADYRTNNFLAGIRYRF